MRLGAGLLSTDVRPADGLADIGDGGSAAALKFSYVGLSGVFGFGV